MIVNAQQLTSSRFCVAQFCAFDAEPGSEWCQQHNKLRSVGVEVTRHAIAQPATPDPNTHLWCPNCPGGGAWHPDAAFNNKNHGTRRGRHSECRDCSSARRKRQRIEAGDEGRAREAAKARLTRAARRARINGLAT